MKYCVVIPWHNPDQLGKFLTAWGLNIDVSWDLKVCPNWLVLQQDKYKDGCAVTKNKGIAEAMKKSPEVVIILDDDCYPIVYPDRLVDSLLEQFAESHLEALGPQSVQLYEPVTYPPSRGTPYFNRTVAMPVAASMGFWTGSGDFDACAELMQERDRKEVHFKQEPMFWRFFPFSGMNCAFKTEFWPHFEFIENVGRFDDVFMGYKLQAEAYKRKHCIALNGPIVRHERQSKIWTNLRVEAEFMEENETWWQNHV